MTGWVNKKPVVLSFDTLRTLAPFDSKPDRFYTLVDENDLFVNQKKLVAEEVMYAELFLMNRGTITMKVS